MDVKSSGNSPRLLASLQHSNGPFSRNLAKSRHVLSAKTAQIRQKQIVTGKRNLLTDGIHQKK